MGDCIFCKIAGGEIPSHTLYEDDDFIVMLDIYPTTEGYTLIIPKQHADYVWDMDETQYARAMQLARQVAAKIKEVYQPKYVGLKVEGTHLAHAHIKVFQFANAAEYGLNPDMDIEPDHELLAKVAQELALD